MRNITVASVQFESKPGDKQTNLAIIRRFVENAVRQGAEIIVFPGVLHHGILVLAQFDSRGVCGAGGAGIRRAVVASARGHVP